MPLQTFLAEALIGQPCGPKADGEYRPLGKHGTAQFLWPREKDPTALGDLAQWEESAFPRDSPDPDLPEDSDVAAYLLGKYHFSFGRSHGVPVVTGRKVTLSVPQMEGSGSWTSRVNAQMRMLAGLLPSDWDSRLVKGGRSGYSLPIFGSTQEASRFSMEGGRLDWASSVSVVWEPPEVRCPLSIGRVPYLVAEHMGRTGILSSLG
eukprot:908199-Amphidinium_carterae.1